MLPWGPLPLAPPAFPWLRGGLSGAEIWSPAPCPGAIIYKLLFLSLVLSALTLPDKVPMIPRSLCSCFISASLLFSASFSLLSPEPSKRAAFEFDGPKNVYVTSYVDELAYLTSQLALIFRRLIECVCSFLSICLTRSHAERLCY